MIKITCLFFLFGIFIFPKLMMAQPFNMDTSIHPVELKWKPFEPKNGKGKGRICIAQISASRDTQYLFIKGVSIYAPTYVSVTAGDKGKPVAVSLHKVNWHHAMRSGNTGDAGIWKAEFKTEGDFGIKVTPSVKPAKYLVTAWTGEDVKLKLPGIFKTGDENAPVENKQPATEKKSGGSSKTLLYVAIGLLLLAVVWLLIKRKNK